MKKIGLIASLIIIIIIGISAFAVWLVINQPQTNGSMVNESPKIIDELDCESYSSENCPSKCIVCPPCLECSSLSCQTEEFCESIGFDKNWYENIKKQNTAMRICQESGGNWLWEHQECEYIGEEFCDQIGGIFLPCESACRHDPDADFCTMQCVPVCKLESKENSIANFEDCINAGNLVMETYPRQCMADGKTFVEEIGNEMGKINLIQIYNPRPNQKISSPLVIEGKARGTWFFEASFPVVLTDWSGLIIAESYAEAKSEWMTEEFVEFRAILEFKKPNTSISNRGSLILQKDNPSGLPEYDDALEIPIFFE